MTNILKIGFKSESIINIIILSASYSAEKHVFLPDTICSHCVFTLNRIMDYRQATRAYIITILIRNRFKKRNGRGKSTFQTKKSFSTVDNGIDLNAIYEAEKNLNDVLSKQTGLIFSTPKPVTIEQLLNHENFYNSGHADLRISEVRTQVGDLDLINDEQTQSNEEMEQEESLITPIQTPIQSPTNELLTLSQLTPGVIDSFRSTADNEPIDETVINAFQNFVWTPPTFKCDTCSKVYKSQGTLDKHLQVHKRFKRKIKSTPKVFKCTHDDCGIISETITEHRRHMKIHKEKQFCNICQQYISDETKLIWHIAICSGKQRANDNNNRKRTRSVTKSLFSNRTNNEDAESSYSSFSGVPMKKPSFNARMKSVKKWIIQDDTSRVETPIMPDGIESDNENDNDNISHLSILSRYTASDAGNENAVSDHTDYNDRDDMDLDYPESNHTANDNVKLKDSNDENEINSDKVDNNDDEEDYTDEDETSYEEDNNPDIPFRTKIIRELAKLVSNYKRIVSRSKHKRLLLRRNQLGKYLYKGSFFRCEFCTYLCFNLNKLQEHEVVEHNTLALYRCLECNSYYTHKSYLDSHLSKKHLRWVRCLHCHEVFLVKPELIAHTALHKGKSFECPFCDRSYLKLIQFRDHLLKVHKNEKFELNALLEEVQIEAERKQQARERKKNDEVITSSDNSKVVEPFKYEKKILMQAKNINDDIKDVLKYDFDFIKEPINILPETVVKPITLLTDEIRQREDIFIIDFDQEQNLYSELNQEIIITNDDNFTTNEEDINSNKENINTNETINDKNQVVHPKNYDENYNLNDFDLFSTDTLNLTEHSNETPSNSDNDSDAYYSDEEECDFTEMLRGKKFKINIKQKNRHKVVINFDDIDAIPGYNFLNKPEYKSVLLQPNLLPNDGKSFRILDDCYCEYYN